ncbi:rRNA small subunit 7-methylguanosine (m7G) methyltransferase gidB [Vibrio ishigakensis]|uniref:rRNA small subunit 7-methylguanosine (M7G) methyltransferase gidB n=1 Tax=Vibrio ishigakensis TaxID=1481914 RepID=A0A0B8QNF3_9VIBR|nr:rRNA small subunit 7-methylguanosine (m7G) methyltransferase gidB [Vibrio sp. JCM 19236]GAM78547.1 rRNA small subunit 7-methylguanosine (m7G) methyltransferase gidB [Vibrio ishigakensis]
MSTLPKPEQGVFLALKGQVSEQEVEELPSWCSVIQVKALTVPELEGERHLVILQDRE